MNINYMALLVWIVIGALIGGTGGGLLAFGVFMIINIYLWYNYE